MLISSLGVWGVSDRKMTFVPYSEISDLKIPDPDEPSDARMHEIMFYTRDEECIFFALLDRERNHREAAVFFQFVSSIIALHASAIFRGVSLHPARNSQPTP